MFAVPWFITLFADVWPLDRVAYAWDALFSVGKPLLTFLAVAVLRAKRRALLRVDDPDEDFSTSGDAFSSTMVTFSKLNAGERQEMPNVRWCVLKALSMYSQMPTSVVQSMELGQRQEAERHRTYNQTPRSSVGEDGNEVLAALNVLLHVCLTHAPFRMDVHPHFVVILRAGERIVQRVGDTPRRLVPRGRASQRHPGRLH